MTDLIKRDDALALCNRYPYVEGVKSALEDLPAIDPAAIREAALRDAGYDTTLTDRIKELVVERDLWKSRYEHHKNERLEALNLNAMQASRIAFLMREKE